MFRKMEENTNIIQRDMEGIKYTQNKFLDLKKYNERKIMEKLTKT